jgi:RNA polymerase sigma factor (TIGR02999 family)
MDDVSRILKAINQGDQLAASDLLPLVYAELRRLAAARMAREPVGHSLQPTALVHEAYLRLIDSEDPQVWNSRGHFFGAAALAMRRFLVDSARKKQRVVHGGGRRKIDIEKLELADPDEGEFLLGLDESLDRLAESSPEAARVVNLRYFTGLTILEVAETMDVSVRTVNRHWVFAKAWLFKELSEEPELVKKNNSKIIG